MREPVKVIVVTALDKQNPENDDHQVYIVLERDYNDLSAIEYARTELATAYEDEYGPDDAKRYVDDTTTFRAFHTTQMVMPVILVFHRRKESPDKAHVTPYSSAHYSVQGAKELHIKRMCALEQIDRVTLQQLWFIDAEMSPVEVPQR